jgi:hypothetical protein
MQGVATASAALGAATAGIGIFSGKLNYRQAGVAGFGIALLGMAVGGALKKQDPGVNALATASAGAAAAAAYVLASSANPKRGLHSLTSFLGRSGPQARANAARAAIESSEKTFPGLLASIPDELRGVAAGLVTLPVAHSVMVKAIAAEKRRTTDHANVGFMSAWQENQAGRTGGRKSREPLFKQNWPDGTSLNFTGGIRTHYDMSQVYSEL